MPETRTGKLIVKEKKGRRQLKLQYQDEGRTREINFSRDQLAPSLQKHKEGEVEVDFEMEENRPIRIRKKGEQWTGDTPPAPQQGQRPQQTTQGEGFHNPYNFIPAPPRKTDHPELGDHKPAGHHRYLPERWTGTISVRMETVTPMLLPDAFRHREYSQDKEHKIFPTRTKDDRKPDLLVTSIKGALRSAYEAITNSRMGVFFKHEKRLAYRKPARISTVPVRITRADKDNVEVSVLRTLWLKSPAKLPRYSARNNPDQRKGETREALRYPDKSLPQDGDHVYVKVAANGRVNRIRRFDGSPGNGWHEGWVLITEPNINGKRYERVFVVSDQDVPLSFSGQQAQEIHRLWSDLIADYQAIHAKDLEQRRKNKIPPNAYLGPEPGKTAWSRHIYDRSRLELQPGTLCYARIEGKRVTGLYPVCISRELYPASPAQFLPDSLQPATSLDQLSPADRVFGWVRQGSGDHPGAYRGNVRIFNLKCETADSLQDFGQDGLPINNLGEPKPQQGGFYVAKNKQGDAQDNGKTKEQRGYNNPQQKGLRGRKVYPHHSGLPQNYWDTNPNSDDTQNPVPGSNRHREYRRPPKDGKTRDSQNRSVEGWVKPGTVFTFDIHVTNLSTVELGALLWLLSLNEGRQGPPRHLRLGGGKPLGFGSVLVSIDGCDLYDGQAIKARYEFLTDSANQPGGTRLRSITDCASLIDDFKKTVADVYGNGQGFEKVPFIAAFLRAAEGFNDNLPIHYPRTSCKPESELFKWFTDNEKSKGRKLALPDLVEDKGLPYRQDDQ